MRYYISLIKNTFDENSLIVETSMAYPLPIFFWKIMELNLKTSFYVIDELKNIEMLNNELEYYIKRNNVEIQIPDNSFFKKSITLILYFELQNRDIPKINKLLTGYSESIDLLFIDVRREKIFHFYFNDLKDVKYEHLRMQNVILILAKEIVPDEKTSGILANWLNRKKIEEIYFNVSAIFIKNKMAEIDLDNMAKWQI